MAIGLSYQYKFLAHINIKRMKYDYYNDICLSPSIVAVFYSIFL